MGIDSLIATSSKSNEINFAGYKSAPTLSATTIALKKSELEKEIKSQRYIDHWKNKLLEVNATATMFENEAAFDDDLRIEVEKKGKKFVEDFIKTLDIEMQPTNLKSDSDYFDWFKKNGDGKLIYKKICVLPCGQVMVQK